MTTPTLATWTDNRQAKLLQSMRSLGPFPVSLTSADRSQARSFLAGLGLASEFYQTFKTETLQKCINNPVYLMAVLINTGFSRKDRDAVMQRLELIARDLPSWCSTTAFDVLIERALAKSLEAGEPASEEPASEEPKTGHETTQIIIDEVETDETKDKETDPMTAIPAGDPQQAQQALVMLMNALGSGQQSIDPDKIKEIVRQEIEDTGRVPIAKIEIKKGAEIKEQEGLAHYILPNVIKHAAIGQHVMLVGPAGSGKTTLARQVAEALERDFFFNGAIASEYKLSGFIDAQGRFVSTPFRKAWEQGGVYLFDEIDASMPSALMAFNGALANGHADFPDGNIAKHPDFVAIGAANTYGRGADRQYVGRNQLDAATLDRFAVLNMDYDETFETAIVNALDCDGEDKITIQSWCRQIQKVRASIAKLKIRHIVSPRASIEGAKALIAGLSLEHCEEAFIWKGLDKDQVEKIMAGV